MVILSEEPLLLFRFQPGFGRSKIIFDLFSVISYYRFNFAIFVPYLNVNVKFKYLII